MNHEGLWSVNETLPSPWRRLEEATRRRWCEAVLAKNTLHVAGFMSAAIRSLREVAMS